jgi:formylglycine-generating enzyme required for sulfatase activity
MALIPVGLFTMGDTLDGDTDAIPTNIYVSSFYMDTNLVSYSQWQKVYAYATNQGYNFVNAGLGKALNHPVVELDWYDCVKWCNARSQLASLTPVYYTDASLTKVFTNGEVTVYPNWAALGYRLPTEAEWEKAARGGRSNLRFPWGNLISESLANYYGNTGLDAYDLGPNGYNALDTVPGSSTPVGTFPPNGYGLYDMAGNMWEWCWDWYAPPSQTGSPYLGGTDPRGATTGTRRVLRGGLWYAAAFNARCADRNSLTPALDESYVGFRCVTPQ